MPAPLFTPDDLSQISSHGLGQQDVVRQMEFFRAPPPAPSLERPCTLGDGIHSLSAQERVRCVKLFDEARLAGRFRKFVPASGAGSRMVKSFQAWAGKPASRATLESASRQGDANAAEILSVIAQFDRIALRDAAAAALKRRGQDLAAVLKGTDFAPLIAELASLGARPKGLLPCHQYKSGARTAFEEQLVEGAVCLKDRGGLCRFHFTVSEEHLDEFKAFAADRTPALEKKLGAKFEIGFSVQKRSSDTIAVDHENRPFRRADGTLVIRPGGHGALIENLSEQWSDLVFVKNIDNVAPERLHDEVVEWKKALGGLLIELQSEIFRCIEWLHSKPEDDGVIDQAFRLLLRRLCVVAPASVKSASREEKRRYLLGKLNRPLRVCGAVENAGEPGGGPFWVKGKGGELTLQIVEQAQAGPGQRELFAEATHFNPVDIVCAARDHSGHPFDLRRFVDPNAVFLSTKSVDGRELKALERPGLWNGGMAGWNTVFIEVPARTFQPIKTLSDLAREGHQAEVAAPAKKAAKAKAKS